MTTALNHVDNPDPIPRRWSQHDWLDRLQVPGRRLIELHALTENGFLLIGESLQDFYRRANDLSTGAGKIAEDLFGDEASDRVARLQLLVERMSIFLGEIMDSSRQNEQALRSICSALKKLGEPLKAFQKITKTLQVIGITTRVECSGHVESGSGTSSVLSDSLRRLAVLIAGNMEAIFDQISLLRSLSEEALKNEAALNNGQSTRARGAVDHARAVLVELESNQKMSSARSERLARSSSDISRSIGEIVSSMQFHDITRQQIEHVSQAIESLGRELVNVFAAGDGDQRRTIELAVAEGCRLQAEQLGHARNELTAAVWRIIESLYALSGSVTDLSKDTCELAGTTEKDGATYFEALEPAIESVTSILIENSDTAAKSLQAVVNVVCAAEEMSELVVEIERFGAEMKVLSLNASVEAVHAKKGGASLSVIADSIQDLANEALLQTDILAEGLKTITFHAESLGGGEIRSALDKSKNVDRLITDANVILDELRQRNTGLTEALVRIESSSGALAVDIAETAASIRIHEDVDSILNRSIGELTLIGDNFPATDDIWQRVEHIPLFNDMHNRYSMKSERDIHLRVLRQEPDRASSSRKPAQSPAGRSDKKPQDLGSNVELF